MLHQLPLKQCLSPAQSLDLARAITANKKESPSLDYASLFCLFCSWTLPKGSTLGDYALKAQEIETMDSAFQHLEALALPTSYTAEMRQPPVHPELQKMVVAYARVMAEALHHAPRGNPSLWHRQFKKALIGLLNLPAASQERIAQELALQKLTLAPEATSENTLPAPLGLHLLLLASGKPVSVRSEFRTRSTGEECTPAIQVNPPQKPAALSRDEVQLFSVQEVAQRFNDSHLSQGEGNPAHKKLLDLLLKDSGVRKLTQVPDLSSLDKLEESFPHFKEVIDYVRASLALAACGSAGRPAKLAPVLLRGLPGTGKSFFAQELANALGTLFVERDLSVTTEAFVLSGMDSGWRNAKTGVVFDTLVKQAHANPVICLNEVDKCRSDSAHNSPLSALYTLLEPSTARHFKDEFMPLALDARHILWILTANDGPLPEPILSRLEVFDIPAPTAEQSRQIAQSVWSHLQSSTLPPEHPFPLVLNDALLSCLERMAPRQMRKALVHMASAAAVRGDFVLQPSDLVTAEKRYTVNTSKPLGFLAEY